MAVVAAVVVVVVVVAADEVVVAAVVVTAEVVVAAVVVAAVDVDTFWLHAAAVTIRTTIRAIPRMFLVTLCFIVFSFLFSLGW